MEFPELLRKNKVKALILKTLNTLYEDATLADIITSINHSEVSYCFILRQSDNEILGMVTETDLLRLAKEGKFHNEALITDVFDFPEYIKVPANKSIASIVKIMYRTGFRQLIVTAENDEKNIIGVVSIQDFVSHLIEYFPETVYNVNLNPKTEDREGA